MTRTFSAQTVDPVGEPNKFERAHDQLIDAIQALGRGHLRDAIQAVNNARLLLEIEEQFREAKRRGA